MTINDILALTRAGWTKDAVMAMLAPKEEPEDPAAETTTTADATADPQHTEPALDPERERLTAEIERLKAQLSQIQKENRRQGGEEKTQSIEDVILGLL